MNENKRSAGINMLIATSLTMLAKLIAVVRQMVLTYFYGASSVSDAYLLAQSIPNTLFVLISTAIGVSFIPVYSKVLSEEGEKQGNKFINNIISIVLVLSSILVAFVLLFSKQIIYIFASGFDKNTAELAAQLLRISIFSVFFIGMVGVLSSYLKVKNNYFAPSIIGIALSVVEIASCFIAYKNNDIILAWGILIANIVQWIILAGACIKKGYRYYPYIDLNSKYIRLAVMMALPIMVGLGADEINVIVDRTMASMFDAGSISSLTYANTIVSIVHTVISVSINSVVFVQVSQNAANGNEKTVINDITSGIYKLLLLLVPATFGLIAYSAPVIRCLYERGNFTAEHTVITASLLVFYAMYIIPNGIRIVVQSYYYAYGKTRFCMYTGLIAVAVNVIFNLFLSPRMGLKGLAIATTLGVVTSATILFIGFIRKCERNQRINLGRFFVKTICGSTIMIIPSLILYRVTASLMADLLAMLLGIFFACSIYFTYAIIVKLINWSNVIEITNRILKRR